MGKTGQFYKDHAKRLEAEGVAREAARFAQQLKTVDELVNMLESMLELQGLNKSELARLVGVEPANIRRLFTNPRNPTVRTISDLAFELGLELRLVPIEKSNSISKTLKARK